jgi:hypothetical protein
MRSTSPRSITHWAVAAVLSVALAQASGAQSTLLNFDDLTGSTGSTLSLNVPQTYGPLGTGGRWGVVAQSNSFYQDIVCRSGPNCAFNDFGGASLSSLSLSVPITMTGWIRRWAPFGPAQSPTSVRIDAFNALAGINETQTLLLTDEYQRFSFTGPEISALVFRPSSVGPCTQQLGCGAFLIDDITVNPSTVVPEPSTYAMVATGLLGLAVAARRRRSSSPHPSRSRADRNRCDLILKRME